MLKIETFKEYQIRLMPVLNEKSITNQVASVDMVIKDSESKNLVKRYFALYLDKENTKVDFLTFGRIIDKYIYRLKTGFYGTSEGYFLSDTNLKSYFANDDKSDFIKPDEDGKFDYNNIDLNIFKLHTDVVYYDMINLFDIKSNKELYIKTSDKHGYLNYTHIGIKDVEPLYSVGDDKQMILDMYGDIKLQKIVDEFIANNSEKYYLNEEACKINWKYRNEVLNNPNLEY